MRKATFLCLLVLLSAACNERDVDASGDTDGDAPAAAGDECVQEGEEGPLCGEGLACEPSDDTRRCATPIEIQGIVFGALNEQPIEGARVAVLDDTGAPVGNVSISDADGRYALSVSAPRDEDGLIHGAVSWTLFASAADHQPFPAGLRPAIPISGLDAITQSTQDGDDAEHELLIIENASTDVALLRLPAGQDGGRTVSGVVGGDAPGGTLVVAEGSANASYTIADGAGEYVLFNVPAGSHTITGYRANLDVSPTDIDGDTDVEGADLLEADEALALVSGSVNIVNAPGGSTTSVVLIPVTVYNEGLERGPVPRGLRAPQPPQGTTISGSFEIDGVPPGRYKVLAALENDDLVRDPDASIAGTAIVEIDVERDDISLDTSFKVTEHLEVISPGATSPEFVDAAPTFVFADDSSEDRYEVLVFDAFGEQVWEVLDVPGVSGSDTVEVPYDGPTLTSGMYYQFRATSIRETPNTTTAISRTEDLRGVFVAP